MLVTYLRVFIEKSQKEKDQNGENGSLDELINDDFDSRGGREWIYCGRQCSIQIKEVEVIPGCLEDESKECKLINLPKSKAKATSSSFLKFSSFVLLSLPHRGSPLQ